MWITPWYPSPMKDAGYDVADFRDIEPVFGTLADAEAMIAESHRLGIRVLLDIVPNHVSDQHRVVSAGARCRPRVACARSLYLPGRPWPGGDERPNDWVAGSAVRHGPASPRLTDARGSGTCTCSRLSSQTSTGTTRACGHEFEETMHFWFQRGVDGFRIDVAHGLVKAEGLPDVGSIVWPPLTSDPVDHPHWDRDEVHDIYRTVAELGRRL